jgi:hypothetical protein
MSKAYDLEILDASLVKGGKSRFVVRRTNYCSKKVNLDGISTIYDYTYETDIDYSSLVSDYNNKRGDQNEVERKIINLTIKNGRKEMILL